GTFTGGGTGELGAGVEVLGLGARLGVGDGRHGADGDARLGRAATGAKEGGRAVRAQTDAEHRNVVVPDDVLALAGREFELGSGVGGELHGRRFSGSVGSVWGATPFSLVPAYTPH